MTAKRWKRSKEGPWPVEVECPRPSRANKDVDGDTIYENSHFKTEKACWEEIRANVEATVAIRGDRVNELRRMLVAAEHEAADAAAVFAAYRDRRDRWEREQAEATANPVEDPAAS